MPQSVEIIAYSESSPRLVQCDDAGNLGVSPVKTWHAQTNAWDGETVAPTATKKTEPLDLGPGFTGTLHVYVSNTVASEGRYYVEEAPDNTGVTYFQNFHNVFSGSASSVHECFVFVNVGRYIKIGYENVSSPQVSATISMSYAFSSTSPVYTP